MRRYALAVPQRPADQHAGHVRVRARDHRHGRGIGDKDVVDSANPSIRIDDGSGIRTRAHLAGPDEVRVAFDMAPRVGVQIVVTGDLLPGRQLPLDRFGRRFLRRQPPNLPQAIDQRVRILRVLQETELDPGFLSGNLSAQAHTAAGQGRQMVGQDGVADIKTRDRLVGGGAG